jgi:predicted dehydrogenase
MPVKDARRLKVGVLGCGPIAQAAHFESCNKARDVASDLLERMAWTHKPERTFSTYDSMLSDPAVEAVIVATSDAFHVEASIAALHAGKHVLCEKPLGISIEETEHLREAVRSSGCVLQVGHMKRFDAGLEAAKDFSLVLRFDASLRDDRRRAATDRD